MFERDQRVQHIQHKWHKRDSLQFGTVTHLHGDPPAPGDPDDPEQDGYDNDDDGTVWVHFDHGVGTWVKPELLIPVEEDIRDNEEEEDDPITFFIEYLM